MNNEEFRDDNNYYNEEEVVWKEIPYFSKILTFISIICVLDAYITAIIICIENTYYYLVIMPVIGLIASLFLIKWDINDAAIKYLLTSKCFIIVKKSSKLFGDRTTYIDLTKIEQIIIKKVYHTFVFAFKWDSLNNSTNEVKVSGIQKYLELISSLIKIIPLNYRIQIKKTKKLVILQRS